MIRTTRAAIAAMVATAFIAFSGTITATPTAVAAQAVSAKELRAEAIYYQKAGLTSRRDLVVDSMGSALKVKLWREFVSTWNSINQHMTMNSTVPADLPEDGHVFVVLGSALSKTGALKPKFERRLKLALKAAEKYPKSTILVSGGAARNGHTEAGVGAAWLRDHGVDDSRILVEDKASSTISNALNSVRMMAASSKYSSYSLVTDSSHMRRSSILFEAAETRVQEAAKAEWSMKRLANVAYPDMPAAGKVPLSDWSVSYTAGNVASVFGIYSNYKKVLADPPAKPTLTSISVAAKTELSAGQALSDANLRVVASYDDGAYRRRVTKVKVSSFQTSSLGEQTAEVKYSSGGVTKADTFSYVVVKSSSKVGLTLSKTKAKRNKTRVKVTASITTATGLAPVGDVLIYVGGKKVKTVALSADAAGVVRYKLPKLKKVGERKVKVKYVGASLIEASAASATLAVIR